MSSFEPLDMNQLNSSTSSEPALESAVLLNELVASAVDPNEDPAEKGFREGFQAGLDQVEEQTRALLQALRDSGDHFARYQKAAGHDLEDQAARLAIKLACNLADAQIEVQPELIGNIARGALREIAEAESVTLYLNPEDFGMLDQDHLAIPGQHLSVRADHNLQRGGCRVESTLGDIDSTRQGRFDHLQERIEDLIKQREQS